MTYYDSYGRWYIYSADIDADTHYVNSISIQCQSRMFTEIPDITWRDSARYNRTVIDYAFRFRPFVQLIQYCYRVGIVDRNTANKTNIIIGETLFIQRGRKTTVTVQAWHALRHVCANQFSHPSHRHFMVMRRIQFPLSLQSSWQSIWISITECVSLSYIHDRSQSTIVDLHARFDGPKVSEGSHFRLFCATCYIDRRWIKLFWTRLSPTEKSASRRQ